MSRTIVIRHGVGWDSTYPIRVLSLSESIGVIGSGLIELNLKWVRLCPHVHIRSPFRRRVARTLKRACVGPLLSFFWKKREESNHYWIKKTTNNALDSLSALATLMGGPIITCSGIHHVSQTPATLQSRMLPWRLWSVVTYNNAPRPGPPEDRTHIGQIFIINYN